MSAARIELAVQIRDLVADLSGKGMFEPDCFQFVQAYDEESMETLNLLQDEARVNEGYNLLLEGPWTMEDMKEFKKNLKYWKDMMDDGY